MVEKVIIGLAAAGVLTALCLAFFLLASSLWLARRSRLPGARADRVVRSLRRGAAGLLVSLSAIALLGLAGEIVLRATLRFDNPPGFTRKHPTRGYALREHYRGHTWDAPIEIDAHGVRGPDREVDRHPGTLRVMALGDSMTYGVGAAIEDTYPSLLETALAETLERPVQVFNLGVPSYNTTDQAIYLEETFDRYQPDLVILQYMYSNDAVFKPRPAPRVGFRATWLWQALREIPPRSYAFTWVASRIKRLAFRFNDRDPVGDPLGALQAATEENLRRVYADDASGWVEARTSLRRIREFLDARSVPVVFTTHVHHVDMGAEFRALLAPVVSLLREAAREAGYEHFVLLDDAFRDLVGREIETFVRPTDPHWNALGHRRVARLLLDYLEAHPELLVPGRGSGARSGG